MSTVTAVHGVPLLLYSPRVRVLAVGGGAVATGTLAGLLDGGAAVRIVAPDLTDRLRDEVAAGRVRWERRAYRAGDVGDAHLVIAATDDPAVNAVVAADADAAGRLCVRIDDAAGGSAATMAAVHRDPLVLGVATTVGAPSLTRTLRRELADRYGAEYGRLAQLCAELRADGRVVAALAELDRPARRARWRTVVDADILDLIRAGRLAHAKEAALACLLSSSD